MDELEECPFCGGGASVMFRYETTTNLKLRTVVDLSSTYWVQCDKCQISQWHYNSRDDAVRAWNQRI